MIDNSIWTIIYNSVFRLFLPPEQLIQKIVINLNGQKIEFKTPSELFTHMTINSIDNIEDENINFYLKDETLKQELDKEVNDIFSQIKKGG